MNSDTITAIATPLGQGGLGVIRISGPKALFMLRHLCNAPKNIQSHQARHGWARLKMFHVKHFVKADEVVYTYFKSPKSYTGEDVVEVSCHGGIAVMKAILDETVRLGARLADRGEFTKRAFLNSKIDLAQAEAVLGLIKAKNKVFAGRSAEQLGGVLSKKIGELYDKLLGTIAGLESGIDFPDDVKLVPKKRLLLSLKKILYRIDIYLSTAEVGRVLGEGVRAVILGAPNVGKSTLMNALLGEERSIVTHLPGTTRDTIEEEVDLGGVVLRLSDTAGLRETACLIEQKGIGRTRQAVESAELVFLVIDSSSGLNKEERALIAKLSGKRVILVLNKIDLGKKGVLAAQRTGLPLVQTCLTKGKGLEALKKLAIKRLAGAKAFYDADVVILNSRHKACLVRAKESLLKAYKSIKINMPADCAIVDLREGAQALGEITGKAISEQIIDKIFSEFCVGK